MTWSLLHLIDTVDPSSPILFCELMIQVWTHHKTYLSHTLPKSVNSGLCWKFRSLPFEQPADFLDLLVRAFPRLIHLASAEPCFWQKKRRRWQVKIFDKWRNMEVKVWRIRVKTGKKYIQQCFRYCSRCWTTCSELTKVLAPMELIFFFFFEACHSKLSLFF